MPKYVLEAGDLIPRGRASGQGKIDGGVLKQTYNTWLSPKGIGPNAEPCGTHLLISEQQPRPSKTLHANSWDTLKDYSQEGCANIAQSVAHLLIWAWAAPGRKTTDTGSHLL